MSTENQCASAISKILEGSSVASWSEDDRTKEKEDKTGKL
jgi:hypothetical protein